MDPKASEQRNLSFVVWKYGLGTPPPPIWLRIPPQDCLAFFFMVPFLLGVGSGSGSRRSSLQTYCTDSQLGLNHRRRVNIEEITKVVAVSWGQNCFRAFSRQLFCTSRVEDQTDMHQDDLKNRKQISLFFNSSRAKQLARQGIEANQSS